MTQPGYPDPNAQPQYGQPQQNQPQYGQPQYGQPSYGQQGGYPTGPAPGSGPVRQGTPPQVTTAAILGFVTALFTLLATFGFFALSSLSGIFVLFAILYLAITAGLIAGGVMALTGKNGQILLITAAVATVLQILGIIFSLAQDQGFSALSLIGLLLTGGIVFLLLQPQAKQFFARR